MELALNEQLKERQEMEKKLQKLAKQMDYLKRAKRGEEAPLIEAAYQQRLVEEQDLHEHEQQLEVQGSRQRHGGDLQEKNRLACMLDTKVLPSLREKHDEFMLRELVQRWSNHKVMVRWLSHFFFYDLDRYFIARRSFPNLNEVGYCSFHDLVYLEIIEKAKDAVIALIDVDREGGQIDRALLKNVLDIC